MLTAQCVRIKKRYPDFTYFLKGANCEMEAIMIRTRTIITTLIVMILFAVAVILNGCGTEEEFKFRNIPFGTKYSDVLATLAKDLEGQRYNGSPWYLDTDTSVLVQYSDIKLYDYDASMSLIFRKRESETIDDSALQKAIYSIKIDEVAANKPTNQASKLNACYNYFFTKLTELYGKSEAVENGVKWVKGTTDCTLTKKDTSIGIIYSSDSVYKQYDQMKSEDAARLEESINSGL